MSNIFFDEKNILDLFDIKNDRLLISSNLLPILSRYKRENKIFNPNIFLDSLINKVGKETNFNPWLSILILFRQKYMIMLIAPPQRAHLQELHLKGMNLKEQFTQFTLI